MTNLIETLRDSLMARVALVGLALGFVPFYFMGMVMATLREGSY